MDFRKIFKLFIIAFIMIVFSTPSFSETLNSLSQIVIDKPIDNSYSLNLYFKDKFKGSAYLQKRKNGSFYVFIPDTVMNSKNIRTIYKSKVKSSDVKIKIIEQQYTKEDNKSRYVKLAVETPVNTSIQLVASTMPAKTNEVQDFSWYFIIAGLLLLLSTLIFAFIHAKKGKSVQSNSYTAFPVSFLNTKNNYKKDTRDNVTYEKPVKSDSGKKVITPISINDFSCFDLPLMINENFGAFQTENKVKVSVEKVEKPVIQAKIINSPKKEENYIDESELDLPSAELETPEKKEQEDNYRPELISELKIAPHKGFYLTTVGNSSFALFGYVSDKVFFLQKFTDLAQINLQARFYDSKDGNDLYILRLDSYKSMLAVSDTEIKELAVL